MINKITHSPEETQKIAENLAKQTLDQTEKLKSAKVLALIGQLGAGKTTFTQRFAKTLGIQDRIISPTFLIVRQHPIPKSKQTFYHIDLYRVESENELKELGFEEITSSPNNIVVVEWAEKAKNLLPKNVLKVYFEIIDDQTRKIRIKE